MCQGRETARDDGGCAYTRTQEKEILRKIIWTTSALTGTFYVGSTFVAFNNQTYYDFFSVKVPLGQSMLEFAESQGWDTLTAGDVIKASTGAALSTYRFVSDMINGVTPSPDAVEKGKAADVKDNAQKAADKVEVTAKSVVTKSNQNIANWCREPRLPLPGNHIPRSPSTPEVVGAESVPAASSAEDAKNVYDRPLPIGFEPPPGFARPAPPKPKPVEEKPATPEPVVFPLVASVVSTASEPIISHLAGTIDNLAAFLKSDPKAAQQAGDVLETAKGDLAALVERIETVKEQERNALESKLDEQTREYTLKLLELEMEAQDKLDSQEEGYKQLFEQERSRFIQAYREKLNHELKVQTELINERLKEEVIAQGIELQRRWIREIKVRVEQERGGRLAKLDELSANLKRLEQIALDNSEHLDENIRVHSLWSALRALSNSAISSPVRKPFREELRVLRHITAARDDPVVSVVLDSLEGTDVPDVGVEPFADLATWFVNEVAPKVSQVALVPDENAGVLSYLASRALSTVRFKRQGLVPGDDVLSVLARAEYHLNEKNLDSAARELNQLKGTAKVLLQDWLEAARRRLEVQQALEVVQTQATLASLLVV
ncbi:mitochondrial inner membrane protein Mitofilin [Flammula alnicola]|nr:mitochondrial inner membrane protein Mitofilin [Flammula alnicola]